MWNTLNNFFSSRNKAPASLQRERAQRVARATHAATTRDRAQRAPRPEPSSANWWEAEEHAHLTDSDVPTRVYASNGSAVSIEKAMTQGGEGSVHPISGDPLRLVKIYHPSIRNKPERVRRIREKISAMLSYDALLKHDRFAWPRLEVFDVSGAWLGFAMMRVPGKTLHTFGAPLAFQDAYPRWDRRHMVKVAINLAEGLRFLNAKGVLMGDVNPGNVLVDPNQAKVSFIDCDSYQFTHFDGRRFHCEGKVDLYTPPELQAVDLSRIAREPKHERFAVAVLLFHVLMLGLHPYSHQGGDSPVRNLLRAKCPLGHNRECQLPRGPWFTMWTHLPRPVQALFERAFIPGNRDAQARPHLGEWCEALRNYLRDLESGHACLDPVPAKINDRRLKTRR